MPIQRTWKKGVKKVACEESSKWRRGNCDTNNIINSICEQIFHLAI